MTINALIQLKLKLAQRREKLKVAIPAIAKAAASVKKQNCELLPATPSSYHRFLTNIEYKKESYAVLLQ